MHQHEDKPLAAVALLTNDLDRPLAVTRPRLSWVLEGGGRNRSQTAYRVVVSDDVTGESLWDSGEVESGDQSGIAVDAALVPARPVSWTVAVRDEAGRWSETSVPARFTTGLDEPDWSASWIRPDTAEPDIDDDVYWYASATIRPSREDIAHVAIHAAAAHDYELAIDGARIGRGLSFDYPGETRYQGWDVTSHWTGGPAHEVRFHARWYGNGQGRAAGLIGLIGQVAVTYADGQTETFGTGAHWAVHDSAYSGSVQRNCEGDFVEECDGRLGIGPVAGSVRAAHVIGTHPVEDFTRLTPELTPMLETPASPVGATVLEDGTTVFDFGAVIPARIAVTFAHGVSGRVVDITAGYSLEADGHVSTSVPATQETDMRFVYTQRDGEQTYVSLDHLGFRYLQIPDVGEDMPLDAVSASVVRADVPHGRGMTFSSSDPMLDAVVALMDRSIRLGVQNQFVDTPTREKGQFLQDAVNISNATMVALREREMTRKAIHQFLDSQDRYWNGADDSGRYNAVYPNGDGKRDIPDFSLSMIAWVWDYYELSGDTELLALAYPYLVNTADYITGAIPSSGPTSGLVTDLPGGKGPYEHGIVDWPAPGRFGYDMDTAARTTVNAVAVRALRALARIARELGRAEDGERRDGQADALAAAMNTALLTGDGYVDGLRADGSRSPHLSQHATSYALSYGIAPAARRDELAARIAGMGMRQGPMTVHILLDALFRAERADAALRLLTNPDDLGWAKLVAEGHTFTWEQWTPGQSESHAWGATALTSIVERLLGIRVLEPGGATIAVSPDVDVLEHVSGTVHTERGPVAVSRRGLGADAVVEVDVPANVTAVVSLPSTASGAASDGSPVAPEEIPGGTRFTVGSGRYAFGR